MRRSRLLVTLGMISIIVSGCAVERYKPAPVTAAMTAARFEARTLNGAGLRLFIEKGLDHSIAWPPHEWDLRLLTLAAFYFNPQIEAARDQVALAQAGETTAAMRPNPSLTFSPGVPSPYLIGLGVLVPVVTAGKREYQIETAKSLTEAARLKLAQTAWNVRSGVRMALIRELAAEHKCDVLRSEVQLTTRRVSRLKGQLAAGEIARSPVTQSLVSLLNAQLALQAAEGHTAQTRAALAAMIGIPASGLAGVQLAWPKMNQLPPPRSLSPTEIQREAVLNRLDVRQALVEYRAAQSNLQLQIARQYPNVQLGPGYQFEEGHSYFAPSLQVTLPIFNRNQGPIAQAEAARKLAADNLRTVQAQAIAQSEQSLAGYLTAYQQFEKARSILADFEHIQSPMARRAVRAGEADWLSLNTVLLQQSASAEVAVNSLLQAQTALGQLEAAVERPLEPEDDAPFVIPAPDSRPPSNGKTTPPSGATARGENP